MKKNKKELLIFSALVLFIIGTGVVSAKLIFGICTTIASGNTFSSGAITAPYDNAKIELTPTNFTDTSYSKKTLLTIQVKSGSSYVTAVSEVKSLAYACHYFNYSDIGAGTWKVSLKQANATGTIKYAGMTAELSVNSNS